MSFDKRFQELDAKLAKEELSILVWGPGSTVDDANYKKRCKMRDVLANEFVNSEVRFSEDLEAATERKWGGAGQDLNLAEMEAFHLVACDLCFVLDTSKGAGEEIAHFAKTRQASKMHIFTSEKYKDVASFPAELRRYGNQHFYTDEEFDRCTLVERAKTIAKHAALVSFMRQ